MHRVDKSKEYAVPQYPDSRLIETMKKREYEVV